MALIHSWEREVVERVGDEAVTRWTCGSCGAVKKTTGDATSQMLDEVRKQGFAVVNCEGDPPDCNICGRGFAVNMAGMCAECAR